MLTELVEFVRKPDEKMKAMLRETKENVQGTNSDVKETGTQINGVDKKEERNIPPEKNKETRIQKNEESLRCSPGPGTAGRCTVTLYVGEGLRGSNGICSPLHRISVFLSTTHNQTGPLWCWFPSGWACAHPRSLWVSPTTSPVRLEVSPAAAPTPMGVFSQRFEALFPRAGALGCAVCFAPHHLSGLSVRECGAAGCYPPLCLPHSPPL